MPDVVIAEIGWSCATYVCTTCYSVWVGVAPGYVDRDGIGHVSKVGSCPKCGSDDTVTVSWAHAPGELMVLDGAEWRLDADAQND